MEESSFFNSVSGDRQYDMEQFATYFKQFLSSGIYHKDNVPALLVRHVSGLQTKLEPGSAYLEGFMYRNIEEKTFSHDAADATNPRIDRIVLRLDRNVNVRAINAAIKKGTPATSPQPPALQRDDLVYEISLAQVRINAGSLAVTDERLNPSVAGLVSSLITVPTDGFIAEWNTFMANSESERSAWLTELNQMKSGYETEWETWFATIQGGTPVMGGMNIYVQSTVPTSPLNNDIWIDTNA